MFSTSVAFSLIILIVKDKIMKIKVIGTNNQQRREREIIVIIFLKKKSLAIKCNFSRYDMKIHGMKILQLRHSLFILSTFSWHFSNYVFFSLSSKILISLRSPLYDSLFLLNTYILYVKLFFNILCLCKQLRDAQAPKIKIHKVPLQSLTSTILKSIIIAFAIARKIFLYAYRCIFFFILYRISCEVSRTISANV